MSGHVAFTKQSYARKTVDDTGWVRMSARFAMHIADVDAFWKGQHEGQLVGGTITCGELGGELEVKDGSFRLMYPVGGSPRHQHMHYHAHFVDGGGRVLTLNGYKDVVRGGFNAFEDTTSTLTRIFDGRVGYTDKLDGGEIAAGVLKISPLDTITQLFTYRSHEAGPIRATLTAVRFIAHFVLHLGQVYPGFPD
jgi:hypothetical protein